jgi:integrase
MAFRGSRPFSEDEIKSIKDKLGGPYALRNRALFVLGNRSGFRISELLSLRVNQVMDTDIIHVPRKNMKGKHEARQVPMHTEAKQALSDWIQYIQTKLGVDKQMLTEMNPYVFCTLNRPSQPITRRQAGRIFHTLFKKKLKLSGKVSTHSWRKTFAKKMYAALGNNLIDTAAAMGHRSVASTQSYLQTNSEKISKAICDME